MARPGAAAMRLRLKRDRLAAAVAAETERARAYLRGRMVCLKCGLEQPFDHFGGRVEDDGTAVIAPCAGPLGLDCDGEQAVLLDTYAELHGLGAVGL